MSHQLINFYYMTWTSLIKYKMITNKQSLDPTWRFQSFQDHLQTNGEPSIFLLPIFLIHKL